MAHQLANKVLIFALGQDPTDLAYWFVTFSKFIG